MNRSPESPVKRSHTTLVVVIVLIVAAIGLFFGLRTRAAAAAEKTGDQLIGKQPSQALTWYEVSNTLHGGNPTVATKIAAIELQDGQAELAAKALAPALKHPTAAIWLLDSKIELELDNSAAAISTAKQAKATEQLGLAYAVGGAKSDLTKLVATLPAGGLHNELAGAGYSQPYLAEILYQRGLTQSANRVLAKISPQSAQTYLLRAVVVLKLGRGSKTSLEEGRGYLEKAVALNPSNVDLHQALEAVDLKLGDKAAASTQAAKITALKSGKI